MSESSQKYTGTQYTGTVAFLIMALIGPSAALFVSWPLWSGLFTGLAFSGLCVGLAWAQWKWHSELTIPSIMTPRVRTK